MVCFGENQIEASFKNTTALIAVARWRILLIDRTNLSIV